MIAATSLIYEHTEMQRTVHRGSTRARRGNLERDREGGRLYRDYFHPTKLVFMEALFRRRHRISRDMFLAILQGVSDYDPYFKCRLDATGDLGFTSYQKCSAAIHMLVYRVAGDLLDEYLRMSETTCLKAMYMFFLVVIAVFDGLYLRNPIVADIARLLLINEQDGFQE
jgi:hypothetical protein